VRGSAITRVATKETKDWIMVVDCGHHCMVLAKYFRAGTGFQLTFKISVGFGIVYVLYTKKELDCLQQNLP
jgi:hypothetical protein